MNIKRVIVSAVTFSFVTVNGAIFQEKSPVQSITSQIHQLYEITYGAPPPVTCGHFFIGGSFLYWKAMQSGIVTAITTQPVSVVLEISQGGPPQPFPIPVASRAKLIPSSYEFEPGFQITAGYQFHPEAWDFISKWTQGEWKRRKSFAANASTFIANTFDSSGVILQIPTLSSNSRLFLDLLDVEVGRSIWLSPCFSCRPFFGARGAWIELKNNVAEPTVFGISQGTNNIILGNGNANFHIKNSYDAGGLRLGTDLQCNLPKGISVYGLGSFSLLYGNLGYSYSEQVSGILQGKALDLTAGSREKKMMVKSSLQAAAGINWQFEIIDDCCFATLSAGYELNLFINQIEAFFPVGINGAALSSFVIAEGRGDLGFQGINASLQLTF